MRFQPYWNAIYNHLVKKTQLHAFWSWLFLFSQIIMILFLLKVDMHVVLQYNRNIFLILAIENKISIEIKVETLIYNEEDYWLVYMYLLYCTMTHKLENILCIYSCFEISLTLLREMTII